MVASCTAHKPAAEGENRFKRKPMVEVTEEQLQAEAALIEAKTKQLNGAAEEAEQGFRDLLDKHPDNAAAHYELAQLLMAKGWSDSALVHNLRACELDGKNLWYQKHLALIYQQRHDGKNLIATWERIVKQNPDVPEYYYDLSNACLRANDVEGSIAALNRAEKRFGISEEVSKQKQILWSAAGQPAKARRELERLAEAMPNDTRYNAIVAQSYMAEKAYAKALQCYQKIAAADPEDENVHISMAECHMNEGRYDQAFDCLRQGLRNDRIDCRTKLTLLNEFLRNEEFFNTYAHQAMLLADTLARGCPASDGHCHPYGLMLAAQGRYAEAAAELNKALQAERSRYEIWDALLMCEEKAQCPPDSLRTLAEEAAELFPLQLRPQLILAIYYATAGDCEKARRHASLCLTLAPREKREAVKQLYDQIMQQCR